MKRSHEFTKRRLDRGDAVLTTVLLSIPLLLICFAFATGISMQLWQKQAYTDAAQSAVTSALQKPDTTGFLGMPAMQEFVNQYLQQTGRCSTGMNCSVTNTGPAGDKVVVGNNFGANETQPFSCTSADIPGVGKKNLPFIEMTLDITRNPGDVPATYAYTAEGTNPTITAPTHGTIQNGEQYRVLNAVVYEASRNITAFGFETPFTSSNPDNCQAIGTKVSAILFGNQEDLATDQVCPQPDMSPVSPPLVQQVKNAAGSPPTIVKTSPLSACTTVTGNLDPYSVVTVLGTYRTWSYVQIAENSTFGWVLTSHLETPDQWSISIDYNGGVAGTPANPATYDWGTDPTPITLTNPTKAHYNFAGFQQYDCVAPYTTKGLPMKPTVITFGLYGDLCFRAEFTIQSFNVTWNWNGGNGGAGGNTVSYEYGAPITVPGAATWNGRTFDGWWTAATGGTQVTNSPKPAMPAANTTYYAHWHNTPYSINYNFAGGAAAPAGNTSYTYSDSQQDKTLGGASRACYSFSSWSVNLGQVVSGNTLRLQGGTTGAVTATASWAAASNPIAYNANGGSGAISSTTTYTVSGSARNIELTIPTRTGYDFNGWTISGGSATISGNTLSIPASTCGAVTVTAQWKLKVYTVTYKYWTNNTISTQAVAHGNACSWPSTALSGYNFWTWGTTAGAGTYGTAVGACPTITSDVTYYAHYSRTVSTPYSYGASVSVSRWCSGSCNAYASWSASCPSGGSLSGFYISFRDTLGYWGPYNYYSTSGSDFIVSTNSISRLGYSTGGTCSGTTSSVQYY